MNFIATKKMHKVTVGILIVLLLFVASVIYIQSIGKKHDLVEKQRQLVKSEYADVRRKAKFEEYYNKDLLIKKEIYQKRSNYRKLFSLEYDAAVIGMWQYKYWKEDMFELYFGSKTVLTNGIIDSVPEFGRALDLIKNSGNDISRVYITIDPYSLQSAYLDVPGNTKEEYALDIRELFLDKLNDFPNTEFCFMFPSYSLKRWEDFGEQRTIEILDSWEEFLMYLHWYPNWRVDWLGYKEWVNNNSLNYKSNIDFSTDFSERAFLEMYGTIQYMIDVTNFGDCKAELVELLDNDQWGDYKYPDFSDRDIVFLGDSFFDYPLDDSYSIPGVLSALTGGRVYNLSAGGSTAAYRDDETWDFVRMANLLTGHNESGGVNRSAKEYSRYAKDNHSEKKTNYIVMYGLNDFFDDFQVNRYGNALREGIETIKAFDKDANILVLTPYSNEVIASINPNKSMEDFILEAVNVASELSVSVINMDSFLATQEVASILMAGDNIHPSNEMNMAVAKMLIENIK